MVRPTKMLEGYRDANFVATSGNGNFYSWWLYLVTTAGDAKIVIKTIPGAKCYGAFKGPFCWKFYV